MNSGRVGGGGVGVAGVASTRAAAGHEAAIMAWIGLGVLRRVAGWASGEARRPHCCRR